MQKKKLTLTEINEILKGSNITRTILEVFKRKYSLRAGDLIEKYLLGVSFKEMGESWQMKAGGAKDALGRAVEQFQIFSGLISDYISTVLKIEEMKINPERLVETVSDLQQENQTLKQNYSTALSVFPEDQLSLLDQAGITERDVVLAKSRRILVDDLDVGVRLINCLKGRKIFYLGDLEMYTGEEIQRIRNLGINQFNELKDVMQQYSISFRKEY